MKEPSVLPLSHFIPVLARSRFAVCHPSMNTSKLLLAICTFLNKSDGSGIKFIFVQPSQTQNIWSSTLEADEDDDDDDNNLIIVNKVYEYY